MELKDLRVWIFPIDIQSVENITGLYIGNDSFEYICKETNKYRNQNCDKRKQNLKNIKFMDFTALELSKWCGLVSLMGIVKKKKKQGWSMNPLITRQYFPKIHLDKFYHFYIFRTTIITVK